MRDSNRVLVATRLFPPEVSAGAFRLGAMARACARDGSKVRVLTTAPPKHAPEVADPAGVKVVRWPVLRDKGGNVRGHLQYASYDFPLVARLLFTPFDILVAESPPTTGLIACAVAALKRRPVVYYAADVWTDGVTSMGAPSAVVAAMRWMERTVLRRSRAIISVSDEVTERLVLLGADRGRVYTVGNGIATDVFSSDAPVPDEANPYFVYTGTMSEWQQPDIFIRALRLISNEYPDLRLKFFGQGSVLPKLKTLAEELVPGRVDFGGVVSPTDSASWIRGAVASLVSIVPGIGYDFARPTKTYAAAAVGTPVLFTGPETGAELVRRANLGLAAEFTPEGVAEAMVALLAAWRDGSSEEWRPRRSRWARENVSLDAVAERVARVVALVSDEGTSKMKTPTGHGPGTDGRHAS